MTPQATHRELAGFSIQTPSVYILRRLFIVTLSIALTGFAESAVAVDPPALRPGSGTQAKSPGKKKLNRAQRRRDRTRQLLRLLHKTVDQVEFDETPLDEVLDWFKEQGLKNIVVKWKTLEQTGDITKQTPISLSLQDVTLGETLNLLLSLVSDEAQTPGDRLTYHVFDGMLQISSRADFDRHVYTRTYYVEDLLYPLTLNELLPYFQMGQQFAYVAELDPAVASGAAAQRPIVDVIDTGSIHGPGGPEYDQPDFEGMREDQLEKLVSLLKTVRPETWDDQGGRGSIAAFGQKLIITQTIEMQEIIGGSFERMRTLQKQRKSGR